MTVVTAERKAPRERHREFLWLLGAIGALLVLGLAILVTVVLLYRAGPIRGHPAPTNATPVQTEAPATSP